MVSINSNYALLNDPEFDAQGENQCVRVVTNKHAHLTKLVGLNIDDRDWCTKIYDFFSGRRLERIRIGQTEIYVRASAITEIWGVFLTTTKDIDQRNQEFEKIRERHGKETIDTLIKLDYVEKDQELPEMKHNENDLVTPAMRKALFSLHQEVIFINAHPIRFNSGYLRHLEVSSKEKKQFFSSKEKKRFFRTLLAIVEQRKELSKEKPHLYSPKNENTNLFFITLKESAPVITIITDKLAVYFDFFIENSVFNPQEPMDDPVHKLSYYRRLADVMKYFKDKDLLNSQKGDQKPLHDRFMRMTLEAMRKLPAFLSQQVIINIIFSIGNDLAKYKNGMEITVVEQTYAYVILPNFEVIVRSSDLLSSRSKCVYDTVNLTGQNEYVWKVIPGRTEDDSDIKSGKQELTMHKHLVTNRIPNILPLPELSTQIDKPNWKDLLWLEKKYTNFNVMYRHTQLPLDQRILMNVEMILLTSIKVAETLVVMHNIGIVHGDIQAHNLLFSFNPKEIGKVFTLKQVFVCDFVFTRKVGEKQRKMKRVYLPPECVKEDHSRQPEESDFLTDPSMDMYSFGILIFQLITGKRSPTPPNAFGELPFYDKSQSALDTFFKEQIGKIQNHGLSHFETTQVKEMLRLSHQALKVDPKQRIISEQMLQELRKLRIYC